MKLFLRSVVTRPTLVRRLVVRRLFVRALSLAIAPLALALSAAAQGSDNCATPTAISGLGSFPFNNGSATAGTQGQNEGVCLAFGSSAIHHDVWFTWSAPQAGYVTVSVCGTTNVDTKIAAYLGSGCPTAGAIACNDDSCGLQSSLGFNVTAGGTYTLQVGTFPNASGGSGTFSLSIGPPPPPCGSNTGPDVIVGDITDVLNANAVGGIDAIALGTTSCNIGTSLLNWIGSTNDHPVIRQNFYRYKEVGGAGRFEQVGLSWLKHGFASLQGSLCCTCQPGGDGQHLGVGCSDPYGAGLNGSQFDLGPNWQVNAHTGVFTYPPADPPHGSNGLWRRCQIATADLEVTGPGITTRFFGECQYVTKDDATAGNQNNNVSWREATVTGTQTNYGVALTGTTVRGDPAIRAWATIDPAVVLSDVQVPADGLFVLGSRATDLGSGTWRYEYGVFNMNSDRAGGSFSVPIPAGVVVTNVGFHDVGYHDGDGPGDVNFTGTDWPATIGGGAITWACETQAQNARANAIRWGTQYNFRFDADAPPQSALLTVGLWKPGMPLTVSGTGEAPSGNAGVEFCYGDGSSGPCPCNNNGLAGRGCENSGGTGGARLTQSGSAALSADSLVLTSSGERTSAFSLFLQGDAEIAPAVFGDGLRCTGGNLKRLYAKNAAGGAVSAPQGAEPSISARSAALGDPIPALGTRLYQVYYRDPEPSFCPDPPGSTFNASGGLKVVWQP